MKRHMIRTAIVLMLLTLLCTSASAAYTFASDNQGDISIKSNNYIYSYDATLSSESGGVVDISCSVASAGLMQVIGVSTINLQRYVSGSWQTVHTWTGLYSFGSMQSSIDLTYQGAVGNLYRAIITFYAGDAYGSDSKTMTTNSVNAIN